MIKISGCVDELLGNFPINIIDKINCASFADSPIIHDNKVIGFIGDIDVNTRIYTGYLFNSSANFMFDEASEKYYLANVEID